MIRGLSFEIDDPNDYVLRDLFKKIDINNKWIYIQEEEIYTNVGYKQFFDKKIYSGNDFKKIICKPHCAIFLNISVFPTIDTIKDNEDFNDYLKSECIFTLIITDSGYFDIYSKDESITYNLFDYYNDGLCDKLELTTDENDGRIIFSVW